MPAVLSSGSRTATRQSKRLSKRTETADSAALPVLKEEKPMAKQAPWWIRGGLKRRSSQRWSFRPQVEPLEDRLAPAVLTVDSRTDNNVPDAFLSLREAILLTNGTLKRKLTNGERDQIVGNPGVQFIPDTIQFKMPSNSTENVIQPKSALPSIVHVVIIDGRPPPGNPKQVVVIDGSLIKEDGNNGLVLQAGDSYVKGLRIQK